MIFGSVSCSGLKDISQTNESAGGNGSALKFTDQSHISFMHDRITPCNF